MADKTLKEYVDIIAEKNLFNKVGSSTTTVETLKSNFLPEEKKGWVVSVPLPSTYQDISLPREQYVVTWIDIYTGRSLDKDWSNLLGTDVNTAAIPKMGKAFPGGIAQSYGATSSDPNTFIAEDFIRLSNIQSIRSRINTESTAPGSCTITLQNPLVQKKMDDGTLLWERFHYKTGRYIEGSWVWYLSKKKTLWYRGKLRKANSTDAGAIKLDNLYFIVEWFKGTPSDIINKDDSERFFAEDLGEPLIEPMQKFKVYAINRFSYDVLQKYGYTEVLKPGETKPVGKENQQVSDQSTVLEKLNGGNRITIDKDTGATINESQTLTADNKTMYAYARPIFTGYIADVVNQQQGAEWSINITGKDVTCWLDYSRLNVNPSLNLWGQDVWGDSYKSDIPIYTIKFAGMNAEDIIKNIFMGGYGGDVKTSTNLYTNPTGNVSVPRSGQQAIVYPGTKVTIHDSNISNGRYHVTTDDNLEGWIDADKLAKTYNTYTGVGNFKLTSDFKLPVYGMGTDPNKLHAEMLPDKLIVSPVLEQVSDEPIYEAYRIYFRQNWPAYQSETITRRDVVNTVCKTTNTECYADSDGKVWFHPIWAYHSVFSPIFVLQKEDVLSWSFTFSDREVITWVEATGEADYNANVPGALYSQAFESIDMVGRFGIRGIAIKNPNLKDYNACQAFSRSMMRRINSNLITGTVTIVLRPELQPARNVFIPWLNAVGYISSIETHIQYGSRATTTLGLKYVRRPWEAWTPIDYGMGTGLDSAGRVTQTTDSVTSGVTKPNFGTNQQGNQSTNQPNVSSSRPKSSINDSSSTQGTDYMKSLVWWKFVAFENKFNDNVKTSYFGANAKKKGLQFTLQTPIKDANNKPLSFLPPYNIFILLKYSDNSTVTKDLSLLNSITQTANDLGFIVVTDFWPKLILRTTRD